MIIDDHHSDDVRVTPNFIKVRGYVQNINTILATPPKNYVSPGDENRPPDFRKKVPDRA